MPKPQLMPLTGGYRRIPVLQIGADVYCDSQVIVRVIERMHPSPTIYPGGSEGVCHAMNLWADRILFLSTVPILSRSSANTYRGIHRRSLQVDGQARRLLETFPSKRPMPASSAAPRPSLLAAQLADGGRSYLGQQFSLADARCYSPDRSCADFR